MKKTTALLIAFLISLASFAQTGEVEMANGLRADGKIYVVVAVISLIFLGLAVFLYSIDRKITKLEKGQ